MGAALNKNWDMFNLLLQRGADAKLLDAVCLKLQLEREIIYL
jgi:hypothetical protein